jgi:hypothetical protein
VYRGLWVLGGCLAIKSENLGPARAPFLTSLMIYGLSIS